MQEEEHLQLEQAATRTEGVWNTTQNMTMLSGRKDISSARLSFSALADDAEQLQRHSGTVLSSPEIKGGREDPHSSPPTGAGSPQRRGLTSTQKARWSEPAGYTLGRRRNPQLPLQRQNTPPKHPKNVNQWCPAPSPFSFAEPLFQGGGAARSTSAFPSSSVLRCFTGSLQGKPRSARQADFVRLRGRKY